MPPFPRPPEWQQQADRHSRLVDPVLTVRQLSRFEFSLKTLVRIDHALVFATSKGVYEAYLPPRRPTRAEITARRYTAVYEVDMGVHPFTADLTLPSDNDAFEFTAAVDISWQVLDPARFVESGHRDVPALILGELQRAARPVARRFSITDSATAEEELLRAVTVLGPLGAPAGLQVTWTLRLRRDQEDIDHQLRLRAIDHSAAEQILAAQRGMEYDVELDRRQRQQDTLQIARAMAYGTQEQELALQQQHRLHEQAMLHSGLQHELALQQGRQHLELQQIEAQKIAFYQWHLQQGGVHAWAMHLAQHPEDSRLVMTSMREDQLRLIQAQMDLVKQLLSGDSAENYELEGPKQLALRTVSDILNQRLPGVLQHPAPPLPRQADAAVVEDGVAAFPGYGPASAGEYGTIPGSPAAPAPLRADADADAPEPGVPETGAGQRARTTRTYPGTPRQEGRPVPPPATGAGAGAAGPHAHGPGSPGAPPAAPGGVLVGNGSPQYGPVPGTPPAWPSSSASSLESSDSAAARRSARGESPSYRNWAT
ncbi:hypothetical protein [Streptomyces sp. GC420]|uniref:hypothetical protein n=1 Tax=Streptomyces sp. GC420 TaxID=2697568 RepID=UPI001AA11360|nr:hypothetical protein [Streptomyces sp. GC420]